MREKERYFSPLFFMSKTFFVNLHTFIFLFLFICVFFFSKKAPFSTSETTRISMSEERDVIHTCAREPSLPARVPVLASCLLGVLRFDPELQQL